jgi:ABC-type branched-subunit amino acid transport system substrate-binding protein
MAFTLAVILPAGAAEVVEIGDVSTFSGAYAAIGDHSLKGAKFAIGEVNNKN